MNFRNQDGFAILPFSIIMAAIMAGIFIYASNKSKSLTDRYSSSQSVGFANEIATKLAQRIRWAYDVSRADARTPSLNLCDSYTGANTPIPVRNFQLCLVGGQICVKHPQLPTQDVCITPNGANPTLLSKAPENAPMGAWAQMTDLVIPTAVAQNIYAPADLPASATSNSLTVNNGACIGSECRAICSTNSDCVTFRFCPLIGGCASDNQFVWQTIALIR